MRFFKTIYKNEIVYIINQKLVDDALLSEIIESMPNKKRIALDMSKVHSIQSKILINYLLNNKIKLFNLQSEVLAYLALILKDGFLKSYINYQDFSENKRELIKRHLFVA